MKRVIAGYHPYVRRYENLMQRHDLAQRRNQFHLVGWQPDFLVGLAQRGIGQGMVFRIAPAAWERHLPPVGTQVFRPQGKHDFRVSVVIGDRDEYGCFGVIQCQQTGYIA